MTRWVDRNMGTCVRSVKDGLDLDKNGREKEAYEKYLQSINFMAQTLLKDAACGDFHICPETRKLVGLIQQCIDRVETLLGALPSTPPSAGQTQRSAFSYDDLPSVPETPPIMSPPPVTMSSAPSSPLPTKKVDKHPRIRSVSRQEKLSAPMAQAVKQNQQLMNAYRARMEQCAQLKGRHRATDLSLTLQRRMAENVALAKAREKALAKKLNERQERLEAEAAKRFSSSMGMSKDEQERRQLYTRVLECEQDSETLRTYRQKLRDNPCDVELIEELIKLILRTPDHPLCQYIRKCQFAAYTRINPLLQKCAQYYPNIPNLDLSGLSRQTSDSSDSTSKDYDIEDFDDLFETEEGTESSSASAQQEKIVDMEKAALGRHFQNVASDVRNHLEKIQVMFTVAYEEMDGPTGRDLCYACIEEPFFRPLWPYLLALSRLANKDREEDLAKVMQLKISETPSEMTVGKKFCLSDAAPQPYYAAIEELRSLFSLVAPLSKLECIVRISRQICLCVEEYYSDCSESVPSIGADDLLPILAYVVVQSRLPQIASECHALEEFVHEGYLMGEEGYCLTSLQTALCYVISLSNQ